VKHHGIITGANTDVKISSTLYSNVTDFMRHWSLYAMIA